MHYIKALSGVLPDNRSEFIYFSIIYFILCNETSTFLYLLVIDNYVNEETEKDDIGKTLLSKWHV